MTLKWTSIAEWADPRMMSNRESDAEKNRATWRMTEVSLQNIIDFLRLSKKKTVETTVLIGVKFRKCRKIKSSFNNMKEK